MASDLFIIEAPGKRRVLSDVLRRAGVRDFAIEATCGHLGANPDGFKPLGIDAEFQETAYRLKTHKEPIAASIAAKASDARRIYLASDDDQEGDVIARDVVRFCLPPDQHHKVLRLRLKALAHSEVVAALRGATPFDQAAAAQGDARRVIDRVIGALSGDAGAVGRVQSSALFALAQSRPVVGVVTHTLAAADGGPAFVAKVPVHAGQAVPPPLDVASPARVAKAVPATLAGPPMNHDQILLAASLRTGAPLSNVATAMQRLYERGRMTYPRARDCAITPESAARLQMLARANGATFRQELFTGLRASSGAHAHEAPNPLVLDVPVNRCFDLLTLEDQVLVVVAQHLIDAGIEARLEQPDTRAVPGDGAALRWHRVVPTGTRLWATQAVRAGYQPWTAEQSLLHFMASQQLGRPSTVVEHIEKFLARDLVTPSFDLTSKGRRWCANAESLLGARNLSRQIEAYIEKSQAGPSDIVKGIVEAMGLHTLRSAIQPTEFEINEEHGISAGHVS